MKKIYVVVFCDSVLGVFDDLNKAKTFYVETNGDCSGWVLEFSLNSGDCSKAWYYDCFDEVWEEQED